MGFKDHGGASIVHVMGGLAGFIGTYLIGPRVGVFRADDRLAYVLDDIYLDEIYDISEDLYKSKNSHNLKINRKYYEISEDEPTQRFSDLKLSQS